MTQNNGVHRPKMDKQHRQGETGTLPQRQQRFFHVNNAWYFRTREGIDQGPFKDRMAAKEGLKLFLRRCGIIQIAS